MSAIRLRMGVGVVNNFGLAFRILGFGVLYRRIAWPAFRISRSRVRIVYLYT
jgi:hypothetical protein